MIQAGTECTAAELARQRALGIIDENGRRIRTELPVDMREGAGTDVGG